ncbi:hypothetical protein BDW62DRAFT_205159 [Aspergillus aurantiobrunneus]
MANRLDANAIVHEPIAGERGTGYRGQKNRGGLETEYTATAGGAQSQNALVELGLCKPDSRSIGQCPAVSGSRQPGRLSPRRLRALGGRGLWFDCSSAAEERGWARVGTMAVSTLVLRETGSGEQMGLHRVKNELEWNCPWILIVVVRKIFQIITINHNKNAAPLPHDGTTWSLQANWNQTSSVPILP